MRCKPRNTGKEPVSLKQAGQVLKAWSLTSLLRQAVCFAL